MDKRYIAAVMEQPILTREEEYALVVRYKKGDMKARDELVERFMKMIISKARNCAKKMKRGSYEADFDEMIGDGVVGLMKALHKFNPDTISPKTNEPVRLSTFADYWIDVYVVSSARDRKSLVYSLDSGKLKGIYSKVPRLAAKHGWQPPLTYPQAVVIASEIGRSVTADEVLAMDRLRRVGEYELDAPMRSDEDGGESRMERVVGSYVDGDDIQGGIDGARAREALIEIVAELEDERERDVLLNHTYSDDPVPIAQLAKKYGITRVAMNNIESEAADYVIASLRRRLGVTRAMLRR